jgi:hypothetical protein
MDYSGDIIDRAMLTVKVALVRDDDRSQNRLFLSEQDRLDTKCGKVQER